MGIATGDRGLLSGAFRAGSALEIVAIRLAFFAACRQKRLGVVMPIATSGGSCRMGVEYARDGMGRSVQLGVQRARSLHERRRYSARFLFGSDPTVDSSRISL